MSEIIASIYECLERIGAGGGGNVYLANHLRLGKKVVLKADKREITTRPELLRREVDVLKDLRHPYIPQVYDFFVEKDTVYTVMDYIQGESLDKPLKRGERYPQAQVIKWAKQLLEALCYLHSPTHGTPPRGFVHSDIKPANLMRTPENDICLIDFNIALALGEENVIGCSAGYASPEHYGLDFSSYDDTGTATLKGSTATLGKRRHGNRYSEKKKKEASVGGTAILKENKPRDSEETEVLGGGARRAELTETVPMGSSQGDMTDVSGKGTATELLEETERSGQSEQLGQSEQSGQLGQSGQLERSGQLEQWQPGRSEQLRYRKSSEQDSQGRTSSLRTVVPDIRSDIYSVGATLYHLLSGRRPARNAVEVEPLSETEFSPQIVAIISKAMQPNPDMRYQTAEEMLYDFSHLHENDTRMKKWKRHQRIAVTLLSVLLVWDVAVSFVGLKRMQATQESLKLAEYSANALAEGDVTEAVKLALQAIPEKSGILKPGASAQARLALTKALGVYDLSDGFKVLDNVTLPSAPFAIAVSPGGTCFAAVYAYETAVYDMESQNRILTLPIQKSALSDVIFVDENRIVYGGTEGVTAYDIDGKRVLWTGETATNLALSGDGKRVAAVDRDADCVIIYQVSDGKRISECSFEGRHLPVAVNDIFADPGDCIFALNGDGSLLAVSFSDGGLSIFDVNRQEEDLIVYEESDYGHFEGGFYGNYFAYGAGKSGKGVFGLIDTKEAVYLGGFESQEKFLLHADERGIYIANGNMLVRFDPETLEQQELASTGEADITAFSVGENYAAAATENGDILFYDSGSNQACGEQLGQQTDFILMTEQYTIFANRNEPLVRIRGLESRKETQLLAYDARYRHDEARISQDGRRIMLFWYQEFRIYDREGNLLTQKELPDAEQIYDQQFRKGEDSWLEVIWYDGTVRCYSAEDGALLSETKGKAPDKDLHEEFFIDGYRIASPLHGTPEVYDERTGRLEARLEADSYLTYVTRTGEYIVTEYISADGKRYGILLDDKFQKIACLPELCDVWEDRLVFDYGSGDLRQCSIYSLRELVEMGKAYLAEEE